MACHIFDPDNRLKPTDQLWRYMTVPAFFNLLEGSAFFSTVAHLKQAGVQRGDPLEGELVIDPIWLASMPGFEQCVEWLKKSEAREYERRWLEEPDADPYQNTCVLANLYVRAIAKRRVVWCWYQSNSENHAMWNVYGHSGIAIRSTVEKLVSALPEDLELTLTPVRYVNRRIQTDINPESRKDRGYVHRPHLIKGVEFENEREARVVGRCLPEEPGRLVKSISVAKLIDGIVLSPIFHTGECETLKLVIRRVLQWNREQRANEFANDTPQIEDSTIRGIGEGDGEFLQRITEHLSGYAEEGLPEIVQRL